MKTKLSYIVLVAAFGPCLITNLKEVKDWNGANKGDEHRQNVKDC